LRMGGGHCLGGEAKEPHFPFRLNTESESSHNQKTINHEIHWIHERTDFERIGPRISQITRIDFAAEAFIREIRVIRGPFSSSWNPRNGRNLFGVSRSELHAKPSKRARVAVRSGVVNPSV
jgi:hypothetical protein